ncbi:MAG: hypothetical protein U0841_11755 [Chloroflexia bacterium]
MAKQSPAITPAAGAVIAPAPLGPGGFIAWRDALRAAVIGIGAVLAVAIVAVVAGMPLPFDLSKGQGVVILLRLAAPLLILRWPLVGGVAAMLIDGADVIIVDLFGPGGMGPFYHAIDKYLDLYYLGLEALVSLGWTETAPRRASIALYLYRLVGAIAFEITGIRLLLVFFPNLFENWFLFYLVRCRFFPRLRLDTWPRVGTALALLYIPKFFQEYILHYRQLQPWGWFRDTFLR